MAAHGGPRAPRHSPRGLEGQDLHLPRGVSASSLERYDLQASLSQATDASDLRRCLTVRERDEDGFGLSGLSPRSRSVSDASSLSHVSNLFLCLVEGGGWCTYDPDGAALEPSGSVLDVDGARRGSVPLLRPTIADKFAPRRTEPAWWQQHFYLVQVVIVVVYVSVDIAKNLTLQLATGLDSDPSAPRYTKQTLVVTQAACHVVFGAALTLVFEGRMVKEVLNVRALAAYLVPGALFSLSQTLYICAIARLTAGSVKVLLQSRIVVTAALGVPILGRRYSAAHWQAMLMLLTAVSAFVALKDRGIHGQDEARLQQGVVCVVLYGFSSCLGSILTERKLQKESVPYYLQKAQLELAGLPFAVFLLFTMPYFTKWPSDDLLAYDGFFHDWDGKVVIALVCCWAHSWVAGMLTKALSTVTKNLCSSVAFIFVYFFSFTIGKPTAMRVDTVLGALLVLQSTLLYLNLPRTLSPAEEMQLADQERERGDRFKAGIRPRHPNRTYGLEPPQGARGP